MSQRDTVRPAGPRPKSLNVNSGLVANASAVLRQCPAKSLQRNALGADFAWHNASCERDDATLPKIWTPG